ncbi:2-succinyl-5-enolpyruvyl-6-hydroxy-3-cyclohexene-1-carboxylate synthase [Cryobacterium mesophilum]|uniref:2-succinyl-5-enolpyruvyl-6-hydroxy-3-cyclohexene-1-carboxylate synthase n=1 Tax=Terrimesophilobacter mesophilus TaxID=433647 RepID=A0A4R8VDB4_9MICO|nr:2-succinyl-5-enolpyruvyl-6-hydroxy-3-cyclohexene-1-carboxylic-acid synthase [Terrimesophilobacter mesophilus]MBB5633397.1 2-succinyl-5-enolpyruvyl-6-hydroxy-3-cyclohexene-1-carboxylate synthase [Terrimesophilobacter mesophilus]TFB80122.1 2-succinyl-5-enolpyruvyl-6-hydroxy-3-cyclohexene-1-carboxylic-acid synthase [Terrimesophilobacter mesophilus]
MTSTGTASEFSAAVLAELVRAGVRHVVVSPGSRSQALALAAVEFERAGLLTVSVRIDERGAGFLALGLAVESGVPAAVITTSGTAVANLLPAVLEAHHSGVPMILLTADRPAELRGIGSNQTTTQLGMFGDFVRFAREVEAPSVGGFDPGFPGELARAAYSAAVGHSGSPGPVQVDIAFREPLSGRFDASILDGLAAGVDVAAAVAAPPATGSAEALRIEPGTVVVAGHGAGPAAEDAARALYAPLIAEVSSGARFGRNLIVAYRELLARPEFGGSIRRVIVFGHPTLSREVPALIERDDVETIVVRGMTAEAYNPGHRAARIVESISVAEPVGAADTGWLGGWVMASRAMLAESSDAGSSGAAATGGDPAFARTDDPAAVREFTKTQLAVFREAVSRRMLVEAVWQATWPHDRLVFASSRLIREADRIVAGKNIRVHANRGLAGIDGTIATAIGISLASQFAADAGRADAGHAAAGTTRVVLGDLAFLHDVGSLLAAPGEPEPRIQLIVGNDGGGTIFDSLEVAATADGGAFDRVLYTPHTAKPAALAEAYGWNYRLVNNRGELDEALSSGGRTVIEIPLGR